ncbi:formyl transferase, partial [Coniella lustricola]
MLLSTLRHASAGKTSSQRLSFTRWPCQTCANTHYKLIGQTRHQSSSSSSSSSPATTRTRSEPLRILFCGSDNFSCASLSALHNLHKANPSLIESIDVLVRPGKPAGRGLTRIAVGPLYHLAESLALPIHQRDTFTGWDLPLPGRVTHPKTGVKTIFPHPTSTLPHRPYSTFNLLIAVSFGLFVPPRILNRLRYGGLNIHPSLLPDLRGPAPIQWSILARRACTGVTLQTLHPTEYDNGHILKQTPPPGLLMPENATTPSLLALLAREGATLLTSALQQGLHVPPY